MQRSFLPVYLLLFTLLSGGFVSHLFAQNLKPVARQISELKAQNAQFEPISLFTVQQAVNPDDPIYRFAPDAQLLTLNRSRLAQAVAANYPHIRLAIPISPNQTIQVELTQAPILTDDFFVTEAGKNQQQNHLPYCAGLYYRGIIQNNPHSLAAVSLFNDEVIAVISNNQGNFVVGKLTGKTTNYVVYNDNLVTVPNPFACAVPDDVPNFKHQMPPHHHQLNKLLPQNLPDEGYETMQSVCPKVVKVYVECDYDMYQDFSSSTVNVTNHTTGLYNVVATIYANETISTQLSQIFVWTVPDAYPDNSSSAALDAFSSQVGNTFNGDLAHLFSTNNNNLGGIAWLDVLCSNSRHAYSNISTTYQNFPTYSWSVNCVTHEMGHNLGSRHTHWCGWSGGALDNCYDVEGSCSPGPAPSGGGTIMSYCHLSGAGVNFNNGFGTQPGNKIRSEVTGATCLTADFAVATATASTSICSGSSVQLSATPTGTGYTYQWKRNSTNISGATSATYNATLSDIYTVNIVNPQSCSSLSNAITVEVVSGTPTAAFTYGSTGVNTTFNNTSANAIAYSWNFGDPTSGSSNTSTLKNPSHTYTAAGTYTVSLTAINNCVTPNLQNTTTQNITVQAFSPCSGSTTLDNCNGTITDGSAGQNYNNNQSCSWLIAPPDAESILLTFTAFGTEAGYDFVRVYDGSSASAALLGEFSGSNLPPPITSSGGTLFITFTSDQALTSTGFDASYNCTLPSPCTGSVTLNSCSGALSDGSGSGNYANNMNCSWLISPLDGLPVLLSFTEFNTQAGADFVSIYNGVNAFAPLLGTFSGNTLPSALAASSGSMFIVFTSDASVTSGGWKATYACVPQACTGTNTVTACNGIISDGSGSLNYSNNMTCNWLLSPPGALNITLTFTSFNTEAGYDFVNVYDGNSAAATLLGSFSGTAIPAPITSSGGALYIRFTTDQSVVGGGFSANFTCTTPGAEVFFKLLLQGPYNDANGNMNVLLAQNNLISLTQPFNRPPWNYNGTEAVGSIAANIVDWLLVEALNANYTVAARRAAFLRQDGVLVDLDGSQGVVFNGLPNGSYYIAVRSRNHLPIVSANLIALPNSLASINFFNSANALYGTQTMAEVAAGKYALAAADCFANGVISFRDFNAYFTQAGQTSVYADADCNLDGNVNLTDFDLFRTNAGKMSPTQVRY